MNKFDVGLVTVTCAGRTARYSEEQSDGTVKEGQATLAELETPDGFKGTVGVVEWVDGSAEVKLVDFARGPDSYRRLESAGRTQVLVSDGTWTLMVRALKYGGKNRFTLHGVTFEELDGLINDDAKGLLSSYAGTELGRYGDMQPKATPQHRDGIGMKVPAGSMEAMATVYAMTRVAPLMMNFGIDTVIGMD